MTVFRGSAVPRFRAAGSMFTLSGRKRAPQIDRSTHLIERSCAAAGGGLTSDEWRRYAPVSRTRAPAGNQDAGCSPVSAGSGRKVGICSPASIGIVRRFCGGASGQGAYGV